MYTASFAFFEALWDAGVTHCFVNLGSDHPSLMEAMVKGRTERPDRFPRIVTCPNEMVALSMADGFARSTGKPQCVIIHVDVGTQGLGAAVHNASVGRAPVLIFAGISPFTMEGEMRGSRTEFIHWMQDVPDQKQIVAQYCRYTAEIKTGKNIKQMVNRALQFARSDPQGPVYLCGAREVMEEEISPYQLEQDHWNPIEPSALPEAGAVRIAKALKTASKPLIVTGYCGRNHSTAGALVHLAELVPSLKVLDTSGSEMNFPANHPAWLGMRYGVHESIQKADVILVLDCDVPWIPTQCKPSKTAIIFHIDVDTLKSQMPVFYIPAIARFKADSFTSISQIVKALEEDADSLNIEVKKTLAETREREHTEHLATLSKTYVPRDDGSFGSGHLCKTLRKLLPADTIFAIEAVTNTFPVTDAVQATIPGSMINCGGGGLGWSGGAALGIKLASEQALGAGKGKFVVQIVGDGTFMFSVPSSVYWISQRYKIPILTIVLNNNGWNAPRKSLILVHPDGLGSKVTNEELNISFAPVPDYGGIAKAAAGGNLFTEKVAKADELEDVLKRAIESVQNGTTAVVDALVVLGS